jgi:putative DNA primase/helicase
LPNGKRTPPGDEADSFFAQDEMLRGLINSGHTRETAFTLRTVGEDLEPKAFSTWGFKAIAGIGNLAVTIADRAVTIDLQRKFPSDKISRLRHADPREFSNLSRKLFTWAADHLDRFAVARPPLPDVLNDRQQDNWDHMFAIAEMAGGDWPLAAKAAALALCNLEEGAATPQEQLLEDIVSVLKGEHLIDENGLVADSPEYAPRGRGRPKEEVGIPSGTIVNKLVEMADKPWGECNYGRPLTKNGLARKLKPFGIHPKKIRVEDTTPYGYLAAEIVAIHTRYRYSGTSTGTNGTNNEFNDLRENKTGTNSPRNSQPERIISEQKQVVNEFVPFVPVENGESGKTSIKPHIESGAVDDNAGADGWEAPF